MVLDRNIPWSRIVVEGAAIVASILLAFWIDAWWNDKQQHEAEQVVLQNLLDDLRDKQELLIEMTRFSQAIVESAETLLRVAAGSEDKPGNETMDRLIGDTWWNSNEALWDSAPMNLLVAGGNLSLVSNPRLVQELAALQVSISRVRNHYGNDEKFHQEVMTPFMISHANMAQISASMQHRPGDPENTFSFPDLGTTDAYDHSDLLSSVEFQNLLIAKIERHLDILDIGHPGVEQHLIEVITMLEEELKK
jgi:hypothetical protein